MSLADQFSERDLGRPFCTFEFFPPRTDQVHFHAFILKSRLIEGFFGIGFRKSRVSHFAFICLETAGDKCNMGRWRFDERSESGARKHDSEYRDRHNSASDLHKHADGVD